MLIADLSSNNARPINHAALAAAGIRGEQIKATEGTNYVNPFFGVDYNAARAAGQRPGAYHFDHWLDDVEAGLTYFHDHYGPRAGDLPPWWDLEDYQLPTGRWVHLGIDLPWPAVVRRCQIVKWCLTVAYGDALIYCNRTVAAQLVAGGFNPAVDLAVAQGAPGPVMYARIMQFPPVNIPGQAGLIDWSAA